MSDLPPTQFLLNAAISDSDIDSLLSYSPPASGMSSGAGDTVNSTTSNKAVAAMAPLPEKANDDEDGPIPFYTKNGLVSLSILSFVTFASITSSSIYSFSANFFLCTGV